MKEEMMGKEKITLRQIIKSVKEGAGKDEMLLNHRNFLYEIEENLKQLEERIKNIIPLSTLKNSVAVVTRNAIVEMLQDILQDILGKEKSDGRK